MLNIELYIISLISYFFLCVAFLVFIEIGNWVDRTQSNGNAIALFGFGLFFLIPVFFVFSSSFYMVFIYS